jgi:hypothetical protein
MDMCPFCGTKAKLTGEHIWSDWIRKRYAPPDKTPLHSTRSNPLGTREQRTYTGKAFRETTKCACAPCNNGWMSRLDDAVKPYLVPLLDDERPRLAHKAQMTLARWAILKVVAGEYMQKPISRIIPTERYRIMFETADTLKVPPGIEVWMARYVGARLGSIEREQVTIEGDVTLAFGSVRREMGGYLATFTIGYVMFQVFGWEDPAVGLTRTFESGLAPSVRRICPYDRGFDWPPGPALDEPLLQAISRMPNRRPYSRPRRRAT